MSFIALNALTEEIADSIIYYTCTYLQLDITVSALDGPSSSPTFNHPYTSSPSPSIQLHMSFAQHGGATLVAEDSHINRAELHWTLSSGMKSEDQ